jgi:FKBP-type peptidyl-prolyl cis-trans isomerase 2
MEGMGYVMELYKKSKHQKKVIAQTQLQGRTMSERLRVFSLGTIIGLTAALLMAQSALSWAADTVKDAHGDVSDVTVKAVIVEPGDKTGISYQCRLKSGEVVAASGSIPEDQSKSGILVMIKETGPISVVAVRPDEPLPKQEEAFDEAIRVRLARMVAGMKEGEKRQVEITAQDKQERDEEFYMARLTRVRTRPKALTMPVGDYAVRANKVPEVGQPFVIDPAFPGRVESVTEEAVTIRFSAPPDDVIETPYGRGRVYEDGENYKVDINAKEGSLVRTGSQVGRISHVDDKIIAVNYRHPFGGEALICDMTVHQVEHAKLAANGVGK